MKRLLLILLLAGDAFVAAGLPRICFNFLSHNEETGQWNNTGFYTLNRARLVSLADYFQTRNITWNLQSDWVFLKNVIEQETPAMMLSTGNKHVLRWLYEEKGVEMDPHAHESQYLYPDVAKLLDSLGLPESKVMGGTIYNDSNGINIWTNLVHGQYGRIFTGHFWEPDFMMGGGTPNHVADLKYYGFWNPKSPSEYLEHDPATPLVHIGVGCELKVRDTSSVESIVIVLKDLVDQVRQGHYPEEGIYVQTIFFSQADLNNNTLYDKLLVIADSANAIVQRGDAQWMTLKQAYTTWANEMDSSVSQWACGDVLTGTIQPRTEAAFAVYPNPASDYLQVRNPEKDLLICDLTGRVVYEQPLANIADQVTIDIRSLGSGLYFIRSGGHTARFVKW